MSVVGVRRCLCAGSVIVCVLNALCPIQAADLEREREARMLLAEGERQNEATLLQEALSTFERVRKQYPDTEAGSFAEFWRATVMARLGSASESTAIFRGITEKSPGTLLACWAQYGMAQNMGPTREGIAAMRKIRQMLPNRADLGPFDLSRAVMGEWCAGYLRGHADALNAASFLGLDRNDPKVKAEVLAIAAAHIAKVQGFAEARPVLDRLASECPDEREEIDWARVQAALSCLDPPEVPRGVFRPTLSEDAARELEALAASMLTACLADASPNDDGAARAAIALAQYYKRTDRLAEAVAVLKDAAARHADTGHGAQVVYEYGRVLNKQGQTQEAVKVLKQLAADKPLSTYAAVATAMAESIESASAAGAAKPLGALIKEAEAGWDPQWASLACSPPEGALDDPATVARQAVALVKKELYESALSTIDGFVARHKVGAVHALRAGGEIALYSLRTSSDLVKLWKHGDALVPVFTPLPTGSDPECERIQADLVRSVSEIVHKADENSLPPGQRANCLLAIGEALSRLRLHREALVAFKEVRTLKDAPDEIKAEATYRSGLCYQAVGYDASARRCMGQVAKRYAGSQWARQARGQLYLWGELKPSEGAEAEDTP